MSEDKKTVSEQTVMANEKDVPEGDTQPGTTDISTASTSLEAIKTELEIAKQEAQKNLDGWQRTLAEFSNYKRRVERDMSETSQRATVDTIVKLLPIIDDFERAAASVPEDLQSNQWTNGILMVQRKFQKMLEDLNITTIDPVGEPFDPTLHEGVMREDSEDVESGYVVATLQKGYLSNGRVLRPALVRVAN